jgi:formiminotetrahydrofolate cyclodeaminase
MIKDLTVSGFLEELSSKRPTPGGGGAAALGGAQGVALGEMVVNLTLGKKKYADVEDEMQLLLVKLEGMRAEFLRLADEDARVFAPLAAAYGLPSGTEEEKKHKEEVLEIHLLAASLVPKAVMEQAVEAIKIMDILAHKGSRLAVSDVGVGVSFLRSALLGAKMNVSINTKFMKRRETAEQLDQEACMLAETGMKLSDEIYANVEAALN